MKLRMGVIGVGHAGTLHSRKIKMMDDVELSCVVDINRERAEMVGRELGVPHFSSLKEAIPLMDAAVVSVPAKDHYTVAKELLNEGKHLLIEKPFTTTIEQAEEIEFLAKKNGVIVGAGYSERFNAVVGTLKKHLVSPGFVEGERLSPFTNRCIDVDVILDMMIHDLDLLLYLIPFEPKTIDAVGVPVLTGKIDIANVRILLSSNCVVNLTASRVSDKKIRKLRFFQPDSYISVDFSVPKISVKKKVFEDSGVKIQSSEYMPVENDPIFEELRNFITAIKEGKNPEVPPSEAIKPLKLALKILEAINVPKVL